MAKELARKRVLVVDDAELNRVVLKNILLSEFDVVEAENGRKALEILKKQDSNIAVVLLDILMPEMDGFGVLEAMKKYGYMDYIPVIIISTESTAQFVDKAYEMGVSDFINKPYNPNVVLHRVLNNIKLFNRQHTLMEIVTDQVYDQHRYADMMINILSSVMEMKNGESGLHIIHINTITRILAETLLAVTDEYSYIKSDIQLIAVASSLHDIGKMAIPDEIINKPGKLTPEEFEVMKTHSKKGAEMLEKLTEYKNERLIKYAYDICLYHHERYDGNGYPCGLKGEKIPIWAQIVSVADVFDALISDRVYKKAYTPKKALEMITGGECGEFNPIIIDCLLKAKEKIITSLSKASPADMWDNKVKNVAEDVEKYHVDGFSQQTIRKYNAEQAKHRYLCKLSSGIIFDYSIASNEITLSANPRLGLESDIIFDPTDREQASRYFYMPAFDLALEYIRAATFDRPEISFECLKREGGKDVTYFINMMCVYDVDRNLTGVVGKISKVGGNA